MQAWQFTHFSSSIPMTGDNSFFIDTLLLRKAYYTFANPDKARIAGAFRPSGFVPAQL
jgi:hypothetical protein